MTEPAKELVFDPDSGNRVRRSSASQVDTYEGCPRKWAWRYIAGAESPPNAAAEFGNETHGQLETYLRGGPIDFTKESGYVAASGTQHLPAPKSPGMLVEESFHFVGPGGHTSYLGYIDVLIPGTVIDHKTTSDLKWAKTESELRANVQSNLYACEYFRRFPDQNQVELRWVYYQTKKTRKSLVTRIWITQEEAWRGLEHIEAVSLEMSIVYARSELATDKKLFVLAMEGNIDHCDAYGGCPYQGLCNISPMQKIKAWAAQEKKRKEREMGNSLLEKLQAGRVGATPVNGTVGGALPAPPPMPAIPPPAPQVQVSQPALPPPNTGAPVGGSLRDRLMGAQTAPAPAQQYVPPPAPAQQYVPPPAVTGFAGGYVPAPAQYAPPPAPAALYAPPGTAYAPPAINPPGEGVAPHVAQAAENAAVAAAAAPAEAPAKRGRKKTAAPTAPRAVTDPPARIIEVLYIDCGPVGTAAADVIDANEIIGLAKTNLAKQAVADWRMIDYGKGAAHFASAVAEVIEAAVKASQVCIDVRLDTGSPEAQTVMFEFTSRAKMVVR